MDKPVDLDTRRGMAAQRSTNLRRASSQVRADQAVLRKQREELETCLLAAPALTWPEAAAKARYLIQLFADTPDARDPRRKRLIATVLEELTRLSETPKPEA